MGSVGAAYFFYFNCWTAPIYVLTILPALVTDKVDTHWECAIFQATWVQTVILFCVRILMWVMEQRPSMYSMHPPAGLISCASSRRTLPWRLLSTTSLGA